MAPNKKKNEIGKGIRALLANIETEDTSFKSYKTTQEVKDNENIGHVDLDQIEANPYQPRKEFSEEELEELTTSIQTFGIIQPITVRRLSNSEYQIISGERRFRAAKKAGLDSIPAYIREADDQAMLEIALLENIQRSDLNPLEVALSYQRLIDECDLTHEELSERLGKKRSSISNYLRTLKLPAPVQKALKTGLITMGHAKVLAGVERTELQLLLLDKILMESLSVRATEQELDRLSRSSDLKKIKKQAEYLPEIKRIADRLSEKLGSKVDIARSISGKGLLKIHFSDDKEFNEVIDILLES
jgi:ParB family chromosome partitioning protein